MNNKKLGNDFEEQFCEELSKHGFWAYNCPTNSYGQPVDVIAVRNGKAYLIDCKVCSTKGFNLSRLEENQLMAMHLFMECGNKGGWFALQVEGEIYMIPYQVLRIELHDNVTRWNNAKIKIVGITLERWLEIC